MLIVERETYRASGASTTSVGIGTANVQRGNALAIG